MLLTVTTAANLSAMSPLTEEIQRHSHGNTTALTATADITINDVKSSSFTSQSTLSIRSEGRQRKYSYINHLNHVKQCVHITSHYFTATNEEIFVD